MNAHCYAAFLRGINVGGSNVIRMEDVRRALEATGCTKVATVLASGNVVFESLDKDPAAARERVERTLEAACGRRIVALVRTQEHVRELVARDPFRAVQVTPDMRLLVTFLRNAPATALEMPFRTPGGATLLELTETEVFTVLAVSDGARTPDAMNVIEKEFGSDVTTRTWNTVLKVAARGK